MLDDFLEADWDESQHPRDDAGKFTSGGGNGRAPEAPPPRSAGKRPLQGTRVHTVEEAYRLLTEKQKVILAKPRMVSTLLDKLAIEAQKAREADEDFEINLCDVAVEDTNIFCAEHKGIERIKMPQLSGKPRPGSRADALPKNQWGEVNIGDAFREHMHTKLGIATRDTELPASILKASQNELDGDKVSAIMKSMESGKLREDAGRIFVSKDDYVVDGHHRWAAKVGLDLKREGAAHIPKMPVTVIDASILEVLAAANRFADEMGVLPAEMVEKKRRKKIAMKTSESLDGGYLTDALREIANQERERAAREIVREQSQSLALRSDQQPFTPPWSAVPLTRVRRMQRTNPTTRADFSFPTVYEENRAEKIKDLAAANELKIISHRRLAELVSNELALDQYDYDVELGQIQREQQNPLLAPPADPTMMSGTGSLWDAINKRGALTGKPVGDQSLVPPGVGGSGAAAPGGPPGGRSTMHGPGADSFRRGQAGRPGLADADTTGP